MASRLLFAYSIDRTDSSCITIITIEDNNLWLEKIFQRNVTRLRILKLPVSLQLCRRKTASTFKFALMTTDAFSYRSTNSGKCHLQNPCLALCFTIHSTSDNLSVHSLIINIRNRTEHSHVLTQYLYNTRVHSLNSCKRNITLNHGHSKDQRGKLATRRCQKLTKIADARFI